MAAGLFASLTSPCSEAIHVPPGAMVVVVLRLPAYRTQTAWSEQLFLRDTRTFIEISWLTGW